jgi:hypothetical protein
MTELETLKALAADQRDKIRRMQTEISMWRRHYGDRKVFPDLPADKLTLAEHIDEMMEGQLNSAKFVRIPQEVDIHRSPAENVACVKAPNCRWASMCVLAAKPEYSSYSPGLTAYTEMSVGDRKNTLLLTCYCFKETEDAGQEDQAESVAGRS